MKSPRVEIICIGSELLQDHVNTHTVLLGQKLTEIGLDVSLSQTVPDNPDIMIEVFADSLKRSDVVLSVGGLGPTFDDISREVWSKVTKRKLVFNRSLLSEIQTKFKLRGIVMPPYNRRQAFVLSGANVLSNRNGTAPGQIIKIKQKTLVLLPGPRRELFPMLIGDVLPYLRNLIPHRVVKNKYFYLIGIPESAIDEMIRPLVAQSKRIKGCRVTHGILASQSILTVKFRVDGSNEANVTRVIETLAPKFRKKLSPYIFSESENKLENVVSQLLINNRKTLAVAESCTGGLISKLLTDKSGATNFLLEGVTTYSNQSKQRRLGVRPTLIKKYGAVSSHVAKAMAVGLRKMSKADYTLSVTGIAGPDGGTPNKPVGLVYIGCSGPQSTLVKEFRFKGDRAWNRHRAALMALDILRKKIIKGS